ncbi:helix-turn-helix transcriptional regulator [Tahibacter harae]|uniref:Helix-turn-helix transcriptional regulator n=1 Tax=Tahibacter harae TaxID=2963937 RepID=A0ABT1QP73_9GAMM|nr:helix-turn-helix domain-containing protein [Tahibacter harae]MCQ4164084.1 helix-turn-helix transcriptional regulator [Tahibacter harae]
MDFYDRLREERARLGLTQQQVADVVNVHVKTVRRWESQVAIPLDALVPLLGIGYDVQYVASGIRSKNVAEVREKGVDYEVMPGTTREEVELLRVYRALGATQREQARAMLNVLALKTSAAREIRQPPPRGARKTKSPSRASAAAKPRTRKGRG